MLYTVYILYSEKHSQIYIGYTSNLIERFKSHNYLAKKSWTIRWRPWTVIYCEYFSSKADAMTREKTLKSGNGRQWIWGKIDKELLATGFISA
jgi:putative endonuclease